MKAITLKVIATDIARDRVTKQPLGIRTDDDAYDPEIHESLPFSYRANLREIIRQPMGDGATSEQMDSAITISRKLKKLNDGDVLRLDDDDAAYLALKIKSIKWAMIEEWIIQFRDDLINPTDIDADQIDAALDAQAVPTANGKAHLKQVARR